jgi:hypothetical protein
MRVLFLLACLASCARTSAVSCPGGLTCPADTECYAAANGAELCLEHDQLTSCKELDDGVDCSIGELAAPGLCRAHACLPAACNDGFRRDSEQCDGEELGSATNCTDLGYYYSAPLTCNDACSYETSPCVGKCGDGMVSPPFELCDGAPPALTCSDLGYGVGFLGCSMCGPGVEQCHLFGWEPAGITDPGQFMNDVHGVDDARVFAVGDLGAVYRYDGANWGRVDLSSCPGIATFDATSVWTFPDAVLIGGSGGVVLRLTATACTSSVADAAAQPVDDLWAVSENDIYAVSASGVFHFDGTAWTVSSSTTGLSRLWGSGADDVYAAGGSMLRHLTATGWSSVTVGSITAITALWGGSATDVYVGGLNTSAAVVRHYNGATWATMPNLPTTSVAAGATSMGRVFVTGTVLGGEPSVFDFDGAAWIDLRWPTTGVDGRSLWMSSSGALYGTIAGRARTYRFPGSVRFDDILSSDPVVRVSAYSSAEAYAVTLDTVTPRGGAISVWDGTVWTEDSGPGGTAPGTTSVVDVSAAPDGSVYLLEQGFGLRRRTGPNTWPLQVATPAAADELWTAALNDVWVNTRNAGASTLSHWNGTALTQCGTCAFTTLVQEMSGTSPSNVYAVGGQGLLAHWDGTAWTSMVSPLGTMNLSAVATCGVHVFVSALGKVAHHDGTSWSISDLPQPILPASMWCRDDRDVFAASTSGYLFWFDGTHWSPVKSGTSLTVEAVSGAGDTVFTSDQAGSVHRVVRAASW